MKKIAEYFEKIKYKTLIKYFLSYFLVISALLFCFFIAFRHQLQKAYYEAQDSSIQEKLQILQENIHDGFDTVFQVHYNLENNQNLNAFRQSGSTWDKYLSMKDLREFTSSNPYISDTIYIDYKNDTILAGNSYVICRDGNYILEKKNSSLNLPVQEYGHRNFNSIVYVGEGSNAELLCFPSVTSKNYELLYILDKEEIINQMEGVLLDGVLAACLLDGDKRVIDGFSEEELEPWIQKMELAGGLQKTEDGSNVVYSIPVYTNLYLAVRFSKNALLKYANEAFFNLYLITAVIGSLGLLLIWFAMKMTYMPLYRLTQKYAKGTVKNESLVKQLDQAFSTTLEQQQELQKKIEKYHDMMQESILDALAGDRNTVVKQEDIDKLFNMEQGSMIIVAAILAENGQKIQLPEGEFQRYVDESLPQGSSCILLEQSEKQDAYLIYYCGQDQDKESVIRFLMKEFSETYGCRIALSNGGFSPLDIPSLYENANMAGDYRSERPVSVYEEVMENKKSDDSYPYKRLDDFSVLLQNRDFSGARGQLLELRRMLDDSAFPPFYTRSVLIDIITLIVMTMNRLNIKFKAYGDVYFETLYYSRSFPYEEKSGDIWQGIVKMIEIFQEQISNATIYSEQIQEIIGKEYMLPEFSISSLADRFHVSIAYMSYLFKKYYDQTFSDYLWNLRVEKAKELLANTDDSIDSICIAVGYENASSFRRKFKKELGITPSQYRETVKKEGPGAAE